jgi:hypothetical protein
MCAWLNRIVYLLNCTLLFFDTASSFHQHYFKLTCEEKDEPQTRQWIYIWCFGRSLTRSWRVPVPTPKVAVGVTIVRTISPGSSMSSQHEWRMTLGCSSSPTWFGEFIWFLSFLIIWSIEDIDLNYHVKVHIFWEGHKILRNLPLTFDYSTYSQKLGDPV